MTCCLAVHAASGSLGASTLAVALAVVAAADGHRAVVVDGLVSGGGLDVTACIEHLPGLRWPDLARARGAIDGAAVVAGLPGVEGAAVLSASGRGVPPPEVWSAALAGLLVACDLVVVDVGTGGTAVAAGRPGASTHGRADDAAGLLLVSTTARGIADATAAVRRWSGPRPPRLVVRGDPDLAESLADVLDAPLLGVWADDGRVVADERRGVTPGAGSGRLVALARRVLATAAPEPADRGAS